jgi:hypothetical protein
MKISILKTNKDFYDGCREAYKLVLEWIGENRTRPVSDLEELMHKAILITTEIEIALQPKKRAASND